MHTRIPVVLLTLVWVVMITTQTSWAQGTPFPTITITGVLSGGYVITGKNFVPAEQITLTIRLSSRFPDQQTSQTETAQADATGAFSFTLPFQERYKYLTMIDVLAQGDRGSITGNGLFLESLNTPTATPIPTVTPLVPEPAPLALWVLGLAQLVLVGRLRRSQRQ